MSLIVATNSVNENKGRLDEATASNFTNFYRSPIVIPPNSEIAVESVKMNRTGNVTLKTNDFFCHYFGRDPETLPEDQEKSYLNSISRTIGLKRESYNLDGYVSHLTDRLNKQYADPRIWNNASVSVNTQGDGTEDGIAMKFIQRGSASGTDVSGSLTKNAVFNLSNPYDKQNNSTDNPSDGFSFTPGTGVFLRTAASAAVSDGLYNSSAVGILFGKSPTTDGSSANQRKTFWIK